MLLKTLERLVARQLLDHLSAADLQPDLQSADRAYIFYGNYSDKVLGDILRAVDTADSGDDLAALALLNLSAAFDTVDHVTLLQRLRISYASRRPIPKVGHVTPLRSVSRGSAVTPIFGFLDPDLLIPCETFVELR